MAFSYKHTIFIVSWPLGLGPQHNCSRCLEDLKALRIARQPILAVQSVKRLSSEACARDRYMDIASKRPLGRHTPLCQVIQPIARGGDDNSVKGKRWQPPRAVASVAHPPASKHRLESRVSFQENYRPHSSTTNSSVRTVSNDRRRIKIAPRYSIAIIEFGTSNFKIRADTSN